MSQALRGEDITIFGSGQQTRSFCYVSDLVDGIIRLMESNVNDPVNIGNPHEMTIEQIARDILRLTGSKSQLVYKPLPEDDPKVRQPDITRARTLLEWEPKVRLEEGLKKTLEYFKSECKPTSNRATERPSAELDPTAPATDPEQPSYRATADVSDPVSRPACRSGRPRRT